MDELTASADLLAPAVVDYFLVLGPCNWHYIAHALALSFAVANFLSLSVLHLSCKVFNLSWLCASVSAQCCSVTHAVTGALS